PPAESENTSRKQVSFPAQWYRGVAYGFPVPGFYFKIFHQKNNRHAQYHGSADNAVHVNAFKTKHFLNSEPGNNFRFCEDDSGQNAHDEKREIFHNQAFLK